MPLTLAAAPRQMLPPPTTTATWVPRSLDSWRQVIFRDGDGGRNAGDLHGDVVRERLEGVSARDEVRLTVDLHEYADAASGVDVRLDEPLRCLAVRLVLGAGDT